MPHDFREKLNVYLTLPSLPSYLVLSSSDNAAWLWLRDVNPMQSINETSDRRIHALTVPRGRPS